MKLHISLAGILLILMATGCPEKKLELTLEENELSQSIEQDKGTAESEAPGKPLFSVSKTDVIKILVRADGAPGMYQGEDGEVRGFYVDLEKAVMAEMGQAYEFVPYDDISAVIQGIKSGVYHIGLSTPDLPDYRAFLNLSVPYEVLHYTTFVRTGDDRISGTTREEIIKSLYGKKVGVQTRGHIYQELRDHKEITLLEYPTTTQALADLDKGLLDAVPDVERIGLYYAEKEGWNIQTVGSPIINHDICTSFSKALEPSLLERYNRALETLIADGRLEALYSGYFGAMTDEDKPWN